MPPEFQPSSDDLARYLEQRGELTKPWNLQMLRLKKLKEAKDSMDPQLYLEKVQEAHADLMRLGQLAPLLEVASQIVRRRLKLRWHPNSYAGPR